MRNLRKLASSAIAAGALCLTGCGDWLTVPNPTVIAADELDPVADAAVLSMSAQQNFAAAYGWLIMYSSWFTGEMDVSETFPTRNEFGRRDIVIQNGSLNTDVWFPLSQAAASAYLVLNADIPNPDNNINVARADFFLAYSYVFMAEQFCRGTVLAGPELSTAAMLDSAQAHFALAISRGTAAGGTEGPALANAARVGSARAYLQAGNTAQAITLASSVPAGFTYSLNYADDLSNRTRVGNRMWQFIRDRGSMSVPPVWRTTDPRLTWQVTTTYSPQDAAYATDRGVPFAIQTKYTGYTSPIRLASKLEADYIVAEAQGTAAQLTFIDARRAANGRPNYGGATDANSVMTEFLTQKGFDFYLEGKRMGDFRRHPDNILGMPVSGSAYWKPGFAPVGANSCYPLPVQELDNNSNLTP